MAETNSLNRKARRAAAKKAAKNTVTTKMTWTAAKDLKPGDKIVTKDGRIGTIKVFNATLGLRTVHNFAVEDHHTYFVGDGPGVWVHNRYNARELESTVELDDKQKQGAIDLRKTLTAGTEDLSLKDRNKIVSERVDAYLDSVGVTEESLIAGENKLIAATLSHALFNDINLNSLAGTGISLKAVDRLMTDKLYRNTLAAVVFDRGSKAQKEFVHYDLRTALNAGPVGASTPNTHEEMKALTEGQKNSEWTDLSYDASVLHQNEDGVADIKYIHEDGREVVYDGVTGEIITDPRFIGTFNYVNTGDAIGTAGHTVLDVLPWLEMGNTRNDPTSWNDRRRMMTDPTIEKIGNKFHEFGDNIRQGIDNFQHNARSYTKQAYDYFMEEYEPLIDLGPDDPTPWR